MLAIGEQGLRGQNLEVDVVGQQPVLEEEGVHLFEVAVEEEGFAQQVDHAQVVAREGQQFVGEEGAVPVQVAVQGFDCQLVQSADLGLL